MYLDDLAGFTVASRLQEGKEQDIEHGHLSSLLAHKVHGWRKKEGRTVTGRQRRSSRKVFKVESDEQMIPAEAYDPGVEKFAQPWCRQ